MEWLEIVDSAVKIGLGASIAGLVSLVSLKIANRNDRDREFRSHRIKTIESVAVNVDAFFNAHLQLISKIAWYVERDGRASISVTDEMETSLRQPDRDLLNASDGLRIAASSLRLLGAGDCVSHLRHAADLIMEFRNGCAFDRVFPSAADIASHRQQVNELKDRADECLQAAYVKS